MFGLFSRGYALTKGQLISKADRRAIDSPKKQTDEFVLFAFLLFTANKSNSFVCVLGESTARQSVFWFYLTFREGNPLFDGMEDTYFKGYA